MSDRDTIAQLADALLALAGPNSTGLSASAARAAARDALGSEPGGDQLSAAWSDLLQAAGRAVGLRVVKVGVTLEQLLGDAARVLPAVTLRRAADGPRLAVLTDRSPLRGVRVLTHGDDADEDRWLSAAELGRWLAVDGHQETLTWCFAEPIRALEGLESEPHGHHDHHDDYAQKAHQAVRRTSRFLLHNLQDIAIVAVYAVAVSLLTVAPPIAAQVVINTIAFSAGVQTLVVVVVVLSLVIAFSSVLKALQVLAVEVLSERVFLRVASDFAARLPLVDEQRLETKDPRELSNRFFDVVSLEKSLSVVLFDTLSAIFQVATGILLFSLYHPYLGAFAVVLLLLSIAVIFGFGIGAVQSSLKESSAKYHLAEWLERLAEHRTVFASRAGLELSRDNTDVLARDWLQARRTHFWITFRQMIGMLVVQGGATALLLLVGGWLVIYEQLTLGQLVAAELLMATTAGSLTRLTKDLPKVYDLITSVEKLGHVLDLPLERMDGEPLPEARPGIGLAIELQEAVFGPPHAPELEHVESLVVAPGAALALVGERRLGRSTLLGLLAGYGSPHAGRVRLDGVDVGTLSLPELRDAVLLLRRVEIVPGTIADNVRAGTDRVGPARVRAALAYVGLESTLGTLESREDTELDPAGRPLCRDEVVLLQLARALVAQPRLLLIDGLLDGLADAQLARALDVLLRERDGIRRCTLLVSTADPRVAQAFPARFALSEPAGQGERAGQYERTGQHDPAAHSKIELPAAPRLGGTRG